MSADTMCPVCRWPVSDTVRCGQCGWEPSGRDLGRRLADSQREYDLRAAARVARATASGDQVLLVWLGDLVRGGPLRPDQIERAAAKLEAADPTHPTDAGVTFALSRLVSGQTAATAFVEIGPDEVSAQTLVVDPLGVPVQLGTDSLPWTAILRGLPKYIALRHLWMAGGVGASPEAETADPAALIATVKDALPPALARITSGASEMGITGPLDIVLVNRTRDWPLLEAAATLAWAVLRPVAEITAAPSSGTFAEVVNAVVARAPLRYGYDLVVIDVDARTGEIRPRTEELFPAGTVARPGIGPVRTIEVAPVTGHAASQLALPIVARRGPAANLRDPEILSKHRPLIALAALDASTEGPIQVRVELAEPGLAQLMPSSALLPADALPVSWPELMHQLPERLPAAGLSWPGDLDLVILVELGEGPQDDRSARQDAVKARTRLARGVVKAFREVAAVKVAVLGYREHRSAYRTSANGVREREHEAFVVGSVHGLSTPAEALSMLRPHARWQAVPVGDDHAAPVEEALRLIAGKGWGWRRSARHVLLILGGRPPHPPEAGPDPGPMLPCEFHHSWQDELARLRNEQAARCFAVLDRAPAPGYAERAWRELTASGCCWLRREVNAARLARELGLTPPSPAQLRLATWVGAVPPTTTDARGGK
jgi:hypothetical protein